MHTPEGYKLIIRNPEKEYIPRVISESQKEANRRRQAIEDHRSRLELESELKEC